MTVAMRARAGTAPTFLQWAEPGPQGSAQPCPGCLEEAFSPHLSFSVWPLGSLSAAQAPPEAPGGPHPAISSCPALADMTSPSYQQWSNPERRGRALFTAMPRTELEHGPPM